MTAPVPHATLDAIALGQPHESDCPDPSDFHVTCPEPNNATGAADALTPPGPGEYDVEMHQIAPSKFDVSDAEPEVK